MTGSGEKVWARRARAATRLLALVLFRAPGTPVTSLGLRRLRWAVAVSVVFLALVQFPVYLSAGPEGRLALGALLTAVPVLVSTTHPLHAWRMTALLLLVVPQTHNSGRLRIDWGWPWTVGLAVTVGFVFYVLAEGERGPVVVTAWALTAVAAAPHLPDWRDLVLASALVACAALLGHSTRLRRQADRRRVAERAREVALEERALIARELHDVVSHHMSVLVLRADAATYRLPGLAPEVRAEFQLLQDLARDGLTEMRRMLGALRSPDDEVATAPQPGLDDVRELVGQFRAAGTEIDLDVRCGPAPLPVGVGPSAYRVVREALSNCARHAPGAPVAVGLVVAGDALRITVSNPAAARPALDGGADRPRQGLAGMAERVRVLGGSFLARATPDGGFAVVVELPLTGGGNG
ncbi:sensor histidine kinase [Saccharothrix syringae]|uniref:histidine kinase n=1 Tax=Saccharothrix syringae TaxID=103733 RepID=A0A5Q0GZF0_SACSY|nr:histidine kinase [Saccharothrix syringae]QFZ19397.1 two-component sensor histidine kinase [Saccharothrix syringae]